MSKLSEILEVYQDTEFIKADGFDDAIIGVDETRMALIYSVGKVIELIKASIDVNTLEEDDDIDEIAQEHFNFNIGGAKFSDPRYPVWCHDRFL